MRIHPLANGWSDLLATAKPLIDYLSRESYYQAKYSGPTAGKLVITDAIAAMAYSIDESGDHFDDWQTITDSCGVFPVEFEWKRWISHNLNNNNYFNLARKSFHGAETKWNRSGVCLMQELMHRDIKVLLNCYANNFFPDIWTEILHTYLNDGFPCGWNGRYPTGQLVVFSNGE